MDNSGTGAWAQTSITSSTTPDEPDWVEACRIGISDQYEIRWGGNYGNPITGYIVQWGSGSSGMQVKEVVGDVRQP